MATGPSLLCFLLSSVVLLTIRFKPIREEFLIVAFNSPHPPKLFCVLCVEVFDSDFLSFLRASVVRCFVLVAALPRCVHPW
jgi:hypothetical protein